MKVFDSLRVRTAIIVLAGLVISNAIGYALYSRDKQESLILQDAFDMAERAAGTSRLLRDISDDWNADIVAASDSRAFRVWISKSPPFNNVSPTLEEDDLASYISSLVPRIRNNEMRVWFRQKLPADTNLPPATIAGELETVQRETESWSFVFSINHGEATWLNFHGQTFPASSYFPKFLALNLLSAVFVLGVVALWLVNRVTAPLQYLARAAERLGRDMTAESLIEAGPIEVRVASRAFNAMQARLLRQINGRTGMLAAISHDLRTPITQLRLRAELAPASSERAKTLATLDEMNVIIGTFLDFARVSSDAEPLKMVDLGSLVESICNDFADGGGDVTYAGPDTIHYFCKRIALKRAITNVIENAVKYGGQARVSLSAIDHDFVICIEDDGPGIPEAEIEAVFQPFRRLASAEASHSAGIGLGLSIAQSIIEDHGGTVTLLNRRHGGLLVRILLPHDRQTQSKSTGVRRFL